MSSDAAPHSVHTAARIEALAQQLEAASAAPNSPQTLQACGVALKRLRRALDAEQLEVEALPAAHPQRQERRRVLREHEEALKVLKREHLAQTARRERAELLEDAPGGGADARKEAPETAEGAMERGLGLQQCGLESLERTARALEDAKRVAQDTALKLAQSNDRVVSVHDELERIESTLSRASRVLKRVARTMASDRYVWAAAALLFGLAVFLVAWTRLHSS